MEQTTLVPRTWNLCCHIFAIGTSNTSSLDPWVLPFICLSFMVCKSVGATSTPIVGINITQPIGRYVIHEKSQLPFNLPYFLYCIYQQHTPICISYWMGFCANYCFIHILLLVVCFYLQSPCLHFSVLCSLLLHPVALSHWLPVISISVLLLLF